MIRPDVLAIGCNHALRFKAIGTRRRERVFETLAST
jgi:hypothetical protein